MAGDGEIKAGGDDPQSQNVMTMFINHCSSLTTVYAFLGIIHH